MLNIKDVEKMKRLEPFVSKQSLPQMMDWQRLEELINFRPILTTNRVIPTDGMPPVSIVKPAWATDSQTLPVSIFSELIAKQQTLCLRDLSRVNKIVNQLCSELESVFRRPVDMHLFMSLIVGHEGFKRHKDTNHNLIAPQEGVIRVYVYDADTDSVVIDYTLTTGDYVFIPAGVYHKIESETKRFSFSFPVGVDEQQIGFEDRSWVLIGG